MAQRPSYLTVPDDAHPLVRCLFGEMLHQGISLSEMAKRSGVDRNTISGWRTRGTMTLVGLESCLQVVGWTLTALRDPMSTTKLASEVARLKMQNSLMVERMARARRALEGGR